MSSDTAGDEPVLARSESSGRGAREFLRSAPWRVIVMATALVAAAAAWIVVFAFCALSSIGDLNFSPMQIAVFATRAWLLGSGVPMTIGTAHISVIPLGLTVLQIIMGSSLVSRVAHVVARREFGGRARSEREESAARSLTLQMTACFTCAYMLVLAIGTVFSGQLSSLGPALLGGAIVGIFSSLVPAGRALGWQVIGFGQRGIARGIVVGVWITLTVFALLSALFFVGSLISHHSSVMQLHNALAPGFFGGLLLSIGQIVWVPTFIVWTMAWLTGAGFLVGTETLVSPAATHLAAVPVIPIFGAIPQGGSAAGLWWLLLPAIAGASGACATVWVRHRVAARSVPPQRISAEGSALCGLAVGLISGIAVVILGLFSYGSLGLAHLASVGPAMGRLVILAPTVLGAAGLLAGYVMSLVLARRVNEQGVNEQSDDDEMQASSVEL